MCVEFTEKQKQFILERIESAKKCAKNYNGDSRERRVYLLGALESVLADFCDESALDLFKSEV